MHYGGPRALQPMIEVNCAALPRDILESELFGHESGAFTGASGRHRGLLEQANGGTLFMDEIGEMPLDLQAKLLKAIEDHKVRRLGGEKEISVDVQIVAASNRDLEQMSQEGSFRADLYHRLSVFKVILPPLREAVEDLDELVPLFVAEYNAKAGRQVKDIPLEVWHKLKAHHWPGNVRELMNCVRSAIVTSDHALLTPEDLGINRRSNNRVMQTLDEARAIADRNLILASLHHTGNNMSRAADVLGISRVSLYRLIDKHGIIA